MSSQNTAKHSRKLKKKVKSLPLFRKYKYHLNLASTFAVSDNNFSSAKSLLLFVILLQLRGY